MESATTEKAPAETRGEALAVSGAKAVEIEIRQAARGMVIRVAGDVDMASSPRLREAILGLLRNRSGTRVIVNMAGVEYIDSSGVASLVEGLQEARRSHGKLRLACLNEGPRDVLQLTRLLDLFDVHATEAGALECRG